MDKLLHIPEYFADTFEPSVQLVPNTYWNSHIKLAEYESEAWQYIKNVKPKSGHRYILVVAMGAGEWYGANKNGDYFPEKDLLKNYKHFETTFDPSGKINGGALIFKHHKNKLAENHPWFGTVTKAFYNHKMHRVELLLDVHGDRGQDIIDRIDAGEVISVSMGVRIPYDECSICHNKAKTREQYCQHLKFELNKIYPDGRKAYAINGNYDYATHPKPLNFFDISMVFRPADPTGYMLKKVASHFGDDGEIVMGSADAFAKQAELQDKVAYLRKLSKIDKVIKGIPLAKTDEHGELQRIKAYRSSIQNIASKMQPLGYDKIEQLSHHPMNKVLSTLSHHGILLSTPEFFSLVIRKLTGKHVSPRVLRQIAEMQGDLFEELANNPDDIEEFENYDMFDDTAPDEKIAQIIRDIADNRDLSDAGVLNKTASVSPIISSTDLGDPQFPWGSHKGSNYSETITDQHTGKKFTAMRGAVAEANFWDSLQSLGKAGLSAAVLGGLYYYLKSNRNALSPIAGLAAIALTGKYLVDAATQKPSGFRFSDQGTAISPSTAMMEKKSGWGMRMPPWKKPGWRERLSQSFRKMGPKARMAATGVPIVGALGLGKYYEDKLRHGTAGTYSDRTDKHLDTAGRWAYAHPVLTGAAGVGASHMGLNMMSALRRATLGK